MKEYNENLGGSVHLTAVNIYARCSRASSEEPVFKIQVRFAPATTTTSDDAIQIIIIYKPRYMHVNSLFIYCIYRCNRIGTLI